MAVQRPGSAAGLRPPSARAERSRHVPTWTTDGGAGALPATDTSVLASPRLSAADRTLVRWCLARYGLWGVGMDDVDAEKAAERAAKRHFDAMPRDEIARRLVPIRKALYRGTRAYTSVAFVLAYYGIDFERNALRVVEAIALQLHRPEKLENAGFKERGEDPAGAETVCIAVDALFRKYRSAALLRAYLRAPVDGHLGEDQDDTIGTLFLEFPADVLGAAEAPRDMSQLVECVSHGAGDWSRDREHGDFRKARSIVRRLAHGRDPRIARFAKRLAKKMKWDVGR